MPEITFLFLTWTFLVFETRRPAFFQACRATSCRSRRGIIKLLPLPRPGGHSLLTVGTFRVRARFVPVRILTRHRVSRSRLPSHLVRAPINDMYRLTSSTRGTPRSVGNNSSHRHTKPRPVAAPVPTELGAHSLRVIVHDWAVNEDRSEPQDTAFTSRPCTCALGSSRCRPVRTVDGTAIAPLPSEYPFSLQQQGTHCLET